MNGCRWMTVGTFVVLTSLAAAMAEDRPPSDAKPLSELIKALEDAKVGVITRVEFDDGLWEVQVRKNGRGFELDVDPKSGEVKREKPDDADDDLPPADGLKLSAIIRSVEEQKLGLITEVEFDDGYWEFKIRNGGKRIKLEIDPRTGTKQNP